MKSVWKHERLWIAKTILRKKEDSWRNHRRWFQTTLQSYSNQNSTVLAQKQTHGSMEQETPEINPHTMVNSSTTEETRTYNGEKTVSSESGAKNTEELCVKEGN